MNGSARLALGSLAGAVVAAAFAPLIRPLFNPPTGGVGVLTVHGYPKGWDYAVIALLILGAFAGGALMALLRRDEGAVAGPVTRPRGGVTVVVSVVVFVLMIFIHDHPFAHMDPFHEGEHLTPGWLMRNGERPYTDVFILHGLAVDGGLDALVLGDPPSPLRPRRLQTLLDALTVALLVPIAAELAVTRIGMMAGVFASLCAMAALWLPVFPYFRLAPLLIAVLALLRYVRSGSIAAFSAAAVSASLGILWSFETGVFTLAGVIATFAIVRLLKLEAMPIRPALAGSIAAVAMVLPVFVLLALGADLRRFAVDSFVILPRSIDAIWSLPAPWKITPESLRYYLPPVFYGFLTALGFLALRRGDRLLAGRIVIVTVFSILLFRSAAGRVGWSHTRYALPLFGIALIAFVLEPLVLRRRWVPAAVLTLLLVFHLEVADNTAAGTKLLREWPARQRPVGLVPFPMAAGRGIYTTEQNAIDLGSLKLFVDSLGGPDERIFDFSNERALYYLLQRKPSVRCVDIHLLSVPRLRREALAQLEADPPLCVIVKGIPELFSFDGVSNEERVPELAAWIEEHYPRRTVIGRFIVAHR
jgi:hypothetical protein